MTKNNNSKQNNDKKDIKAGRIFTTLVLVVCAAFVICTVFSLADNGKDASYGTADIIVRSGDTLYSIAREYCEDVPVDSVVSDILKLNNMSSTLIYAGQDLIIPIYS